MQIMDIQPRNNGFFCLFCLVAFVPLSGGGQNTEDPTQPDQ